MRTTVFFFSDLPAALRRRELPRSGAIEQGIGT